jgi:hypothetical protein
MPASFPLKTLALVKEDSEVLGTRHLSACLADEREESPIFFPSLNLRSARKCFVLYARIR